MNPTDDQLRVAVCKVMGWSVIDSAFRGLPPNETDNLKYEQLPPLTLDLMWRAEETLDGGERWKYADILHAQIYNENHDEYSKCAGFHGLHSTAVQRARAFLKVKGINPFA